MSAWVSAADIACECAPPPSAHGKEGSGYERAPFVSACVILRPGASPRITGMIGVGGGYSSRRGPRTGGACAGWRDPTIEEGSVSWALLAEPYMTMSHFIL